MALTSKILTLSGRDFMRGMNSGQFFNDGFFSSNISRGINLINKPGAIYPQQIATDITPSSPGRFAAGCKGGGASPGLGYKNNYFVTETGKFYSYNGTFLNNEVNGTSIYNNPKSDIIFYKEAVYATSNSNITLSAMSGYSIISVNETWWTSTRGHISLSNVVPHPMLVFEDILWIADGLNLHKWDNTLSTPNALILTDDQNITALAIEPGSGRMMIATTQGANGSGTLPRINKIALWDGFSNKVLRSVIVDDMITAMYAVGGTVYITYGLNLGYWNGSGITFLRKLSKILGYSGLNLAYKQKITSQGNRLYVVDGTLVISYHSIIGSSPKVFYYAFGQTTNLINQVGSLNLIIDLGEDKLAISYIGNGVSYFFVVNMVNAVDAAVANSGSVSWTTEFFILDKPVIIRKIRIFYTSPIPPTVSPVGIIVSSSDQMEDVVFEYTSNNFLTEPQSVLDYIPRSSSKKELEDFSLRIVDGNSAYSAGIRKVQVYYDFVE